MRRRAFDLVFLDTNVTMFRVAIVVPLMGRRAVDRNRLKRRIREVLGRMGVLGKAHGDLVVRARRAAYDLDYREITEELNGMMSSLSEGKWA
jgi:ribonuclease P protein component